MKIGLYRKAIAVLLTAALGVAAQFVPALADQIGAETIAAASGALAVLVAWKTENRLDGWNVNDLAAAILQAADEVAGAKQGASGSA